MFFRLLIAFVAFSLLGSALFGVLLAQRMDANDWSRFVSDALPFALLAPLLAIGPAYWFARRFHRPLQELMDGAHRISKGEYGHSLTGGTWGESRTLAQSFNAMSARLAEQIKQLETDRRQLRTILSGMVEGVIAVDAQQRVLFANETAGRLLEFDAEAAVGRTFSELNHQPQVLEVLTKAIAGIEPQRIEIDLKGPLSRQLAVYIAPFPNESRRQGAVLVANDISELRRLERLRQDFVANVSHELKTPLSVIKACVEALLDGASEDPEARLPFIEQVSEQAERLHALILDLLSLARIESGQELLDLGAVNLVSAVRECVDRHRLRAETKSVSLIAEPDRNLRLAVWADEEGVKQILDNLVDNAVKYSPHSGRVNIRWSGGTNDVSIQVEDNGPGIPDRDLQRIFERFYRVDRARSRELGGTGLGLAIVKHLVQAMNGNVRATSTLGKGTTFTVTLPRAKDE